MYLTDTEKHEIKGFLTETFIEVIPTMEEDYRYVSSKKSTVMIQFGQKTLGTVQIPKLSHRDDLSESDIKAIAADCFLEQATDKEIQTVLKEYAIYEEYIEEQIAEAEAEREQMQAYHL